MSDPLAYLTAALDAAQRQAEAAATRAWSPHWEYDPMVRQIRDLNNGNELANIYWPAIGFFVDVNDPASVLRRVAADRKILKAHPYTTRVINPGCGLQSAGFGCETCHNWDGVPEGRGNCATVLALAEGYGWTETETR